MVEFGIPRAVRTRMSLLLVAILTASTPSAPVLVRSGVRTQLDVGAMMGATWFVSTGRAQLTSAMEVTRKSFFETWQMDPNLVAQATPVVGPCVMAAGTADAVERALLLASGGLQAMGLSVQMLRLMSPDDARIAEEGPMLKISPIAAGHLGLSVRLSWK